MLHGAIRVALNKPKVLETCWATRLQCEAVINKHAVTRFLIVVRDVSLERSDNLLLNGRFRWIRMEDFLRTELAPFGTGVISLFGFGFRRAMGITGTISALIMPIKPMVRRYHMVHIMLPGEVLIWKSLIWPDRIWHDAFFGLLAKCLIGMNRRAVGNVPSYWLVVQSTLSPVCRLFPRASRVEWALGTPHYHDLFTGIRF